MHKPSGPAEGARERHRGVGGRDARAVLPGWHTTTAARPCGPTLHPPSHVGPLFEPENACHSFKVKCVRRRAAAPASPWASHLPGRRGATPPRGCRTRQRRGRAHGQSQCLSLQRGGGVQARNGFRGASGRACTAGSSSQMVLGRRTCCIHLWLQRCHRETPL